MITSYRHSLMGISLVGGCVLKKTFVCVHDHSSYIFCQSKAQVTELCHQCFPEDTVSQVSECEVTVCGTNHHHPEHKTKERGRAKASQASLCCLEAGWLFSLLIFREGDNKRRRQRLKKNRMRTYSVTRALVT